MEKTIDYDLPKIIFVRRVATEPGFLHPFFNSMRTANENEWRGHEPGTCAVIGLNIQPWPMMRMGNIVITTIGLWGEPLPEFYRRERFCDTDFGEEFDEPLPGATLGDTIDDLLLAVKAE